MRRSVVQAGLARVSHQRGEKRALWASTLLTVARLARPEPDIVRELVDGPKGSRLTRGLILSPLADGLQRRVET